MKFVDITVGPDQTRASGWTSMRRDCQECGRVFDLNDSTDEQEWYFGHDCED